MPAPIQQAPPPFSSQLKIGLIREGKVPADKRVPLTPKKSVEAQSTYPGLQVVVQSSLIRSYTDQEYRDLGLTVQDDVAACDVLMGVKEVAHYAAHSQ